MTSILSIFIPSLSFSVRPWLQGNIKLDILYILDMFICINWLLFFIAHYLFVFCFTMSIYSIVILHSINQHIFVSTHLCIIYQSIYIHLDERPLHSLLHTFLPTIQGPVTFNGHDWSMIISHHDFFVDIFISI